MTFVYVALAFLTGMAVGAFTVVRATPRLVARLSRDEQIAFARKVRAWTMVRSRT